MAIFILQAPAIAAPTNSLGHLRMVAVTLLRADQGRVSQAHSHGTPRDEAPNQFSMPSVGTVL